MVGAYAKTSAVSPSLAAIRSKLIHTLTSPARVTKGPDIPREDRTWEPRNPSLPTALSCKDVIHLLAFAEMVAMESPAPPANVIANGRAFHS